MSSTMARLFDTQTDIFNRLAQLRNNLVKLAKDKRTEERLLSVYENARETVALFNTNHEQLLIISPVLPEDYYHIKTNIDGIYNEIITFIETHFPGLCDPSEIKKSPPVATPLGGIQSTSSGNADTNAPKLQDDQTNEDDTNNLFVQDTLSGTAPEVTNQTQPPETTEGNTVYATDPKIAQILEMLAGSQVSQAAQMASTLNQNFRSEMSTQPTLRLPEVSIPVFDGDVRHYKTFRDTFLSIMSRSRISDVEKFLFLKSKLSGTALKAIENLTAIGINYNTAWELLNTRFDNERLMIESYVEALLNAQPTNHSKASSIIKYLQEYQSILHNMSTMHIDVENPVFTVLILRKIDPKTLSRFEDQIGSRSTMPTIRELNNFMEKEYAVLSRRKDAEFVKPSKAAKHTASHATVGDEPRKRTVRCFICEEEHPTKSCPLFLASNDRDALLRKHKICIFCVKHKFDYRNPCKSKDYLICGICKGSHITEMHPVKEEKSSNTFLTKNASPSSSGVILPTAIAPLLTPDGREIPIRCLVDQCSQSSYITEDLVQKLGLKKKKVFVQIKGVGGSMSSSQGIVSLTIKLHNKANKLIKFKALVVKRVTGKLPSLPCHKNLKSWSSKKLADPHFDQPAQIPMLLGSNVLPQLFCEGVETIDGFLLQNTHLGYIISGSGNDSQNLSAFTSTHIARTEFEQQVAEFLEMPLFNLDEGNEIVDVKDAECMMQFNNECERTEDGRYMVPTPFKQDPPPLGNSFRKALNFFLAQEKRWEKDPVLYDKSNEFMKEYLALDHMEKIPCELQRNETGEAYYIPYMSIIRKDALTTKLRNVFNASAATSNGNSLNDQILAGPKLQTSIFDVITQVRQFRFIYGADITKMFRQILVKKEDRNKLRIIWRASKNQPLEEYWLNTVTYGTNCAPFQAIATLRRCGDDNAPNKAIERIIHDAFYMDDLFWGSDSINEAKQQIHDITSTLEAGKFPLTKFMSNDSKVLEDIEKKDKVESYLELTNDNAKVKTLGIIYDPIADAFGFNIKRFSNITYTKRGLLSAVASIFDPLGFILPVVMLLRMLIQQLWLADYDWDASIDEAIAKKFAKCLDCISLINKIKIPRWTGSAKNEDIELIGFCDASFDGYAAVIYSRVKTLLGFEINLIAARGKIAPIKSKRNLNDEEKKVTIPKLELEGLCLLADLMVSVKKSFTNLNIMIQAYTDSEIVMKWVRSIEEKDNKFVRRRVHKIRKVFPPANVNHVRSEDNPADSASRGLTAEKLISHELWFNGPHWLKEDPLPFSAFTETVTLVTRTQDTVFNFIERFSQLNRLIRAMAYMIRWKTKKQGAFTAEELENARIQVIKFQQQIAFGDDIKRLGKNIKLSAKSWIRPLCPFINKDGLLCVGGRLERANLPELQKHPILLPKGSLADMIIRHTHQKFGHASNSFILHSIRTEFYFPAMKRTIKKWLNTCIICRRFTAKPLQPMMADLPAVRVNPEPAFSAIGCDLFGYMNIRSSRQKFEKTIKVWGVIFVCLFTKCVHVEICLDLTTDNFLDAFARFTSRRGTPREIISDRGTNLVGAKRKIKEAWNKIIDEGIEKLAIEHITWKTIPSKSPTFGGIYERIVGLIKYFLKRVNNIDRLTYEELHTLLCVIEGYVNSRPLYPESEDPNDLLALTPFLLVTQRNFTAPPLEWVQRDSTPITKRWLQIQQVQRQFWKKFEEEYLSLLQKRYKWIDETRQVQLGDVMIIREPFLPAPAWKLGRIIKLYPDEKGVSRRVDLKTKDKDAIHRAVKQLVPLLPEAEVLASPKQPRVTRGANQLSPFLLISVLIGMIASFIPVNAMSITHLSPGIHLKTLGNVSMKAFEFPFTINTKINLTEDLEQISNYVQDLEKFCEDPSFKTHPDIAKHCISTSNAVASEADFVRQKLISNVIVKRSKRTAILMTKLLTGVIKFAPEIALASGLIYQAVENHQLTRSIEIMQQHVETLRTKTVKISTLLLNITDTEFAAVDEKINQLLLNQQDIAVMEKITEYAAGIQLIISSLLAKHEDILRIRPFEKLQHYVDSFNHTRTLKLPEVEFPSQWFQFFPPTKTLQDNILEITFRIPLVQDTFTEIAIISIPDDQSFANILPGDTLVDIIAISSDNSSMFRPRSFRKLAYNLFDEILLTNMPQCIDDLLRRKISPNCTKFAKVALKNQLIPLNEEFIIAYIAPNTSLPIFCKSINSELHFSSLINISDCEQHTEVDIPARSLDLTLSSANFTLIEYEHKDVQLRNQIAAEISTLNKEFDWTSSSFWRFGLTICCSSLLSIFGSLWLYVRCSRRKSFIPNLDENTGSKIFAQWAKTNPDNVVFSTNN